MLHVPPALEGLTPEQVAEFYAGLPEHVVVKIAASSQTAGPAAATPAEHAAQVDDGYVSRPHLDYLSARLAQAVRDVEAGRSRMLRVSMPPRAGKSVLTSVHLPVWLLLQHPDWKLGLISHDPVLAAGWGREVRSMIEQHGPARGVKVARDAGAVGNWLTTDGGGVVARSTPGQSLVGRGFKVLIIDDAVKDFPSAHSEKAREALWEWWTSNAFTRLEPPYLVVVVGCLTGDTPVLMADGTERRIEDVRPGDRVATYEGGQLVVSTVTNWANQGPDDLYAVRMASGRTVRANARHPFLTIDASGVEAWTRTDQLRPGMAILSLSGLGAESPARQTGARSLSSPRANASIIPLSGGSARSGSGKAGQTADANGKGSPARSATSRSAPKGSASPTTTKLAGPQEKGGTHRSRTAALTSATATASTPRTMTPCLLSRAGYVRSASGLLIPRTLAAEESYSSTTATTRSMSGGFSATTATSSLDTGPRQNDSAPLSHTLRLVPDRVESVTPCGTEDVFDIEVDRTHNFIANGLVTHNTRWHQDDLIGRLGSPEYPGDPGEWEVIEFPAIATEGDVLGREPGDPLYSPLLEESRDDAVARWDSVQDAVGRYVFAAQYQQSPSPAKGAIFDVDSLRYWTTDPAHVSDTVRYLDPDQAGGRLWLDSWDMAFKALDTSDYVVGQRWMMEPPYRYLIAQTRGRRTFNESLAEVKRWCDPHLTPYARHVHKRLIEEKANGAAIIDTLRKTVAGIKPINPTDSKEARMWAVTPEVESGHVLLPYPGDPGNGWVLDLVAELREAPNGAHDDQVDAFTQALMELRLSAAARLAAPPGSPELQPGVTARTPGGRVAAARSMRRTGTLGR